MIETHLQLLLWVNQSSLRKQIRNRDYKFVTCNVTLILKVWRLRATEIIRDSLFGRGIEEHMVIKCKTSQRDGF